MDGDVASMSVTMRGDVASTPSKERPVNAQTINSQLNFINGTAVNLLLRELGAGPYPGPRAMGVSLSTTYTSNWQETCASRFNCTSDGLVNKLGQLTSCPAANSTIQSTPDIWGITYEACQAKCGRHLLVQTVDFSSAAIPLTTWLLPWIALIAQLPFEADGWTDLLSACLCVGSPALATYSLALTTLNRGYIADKFKLLKQTAERETHQGYHYMIDRINAAAFILQEAQQCPMRANQRTGELASLIVLNDPHRQSFWKVAAKDLKNTRRGFTYSFLAQVFLAFVTYLISFIAAVQESLGSPDVGLQFASSTVWSWMFPIVFGYIRVGSQYKAGAIEEALVSNAIIPHRDLSADAEFLHQKGLRPNADLYSPLPAPDTVANLDADVMYPEGLQLRVESTGPPAASTSQGVHISSHPSQSSDMLGIPLSMFHASTSQLNAASVATTDQNESLETHELFPPAAAIQLDRALPPPTWWGIDVRGDERREGPIFNYARALTFVACAEHVRGGFESAIERFRARAAIPRTREDAADLCGFDLQEDLVAFTSWSKIPRFVIHHMCYAAILALFLQWGTTGAAIFVAYNTPSIGIGCRSGSYLIYGIAATLSWLLLVLSNLVSHAVMQRLEQDRKGGSLGILGGIAVTTRFTGKALAVLNAGWLIASSILEDIGTFQTCWCQTNAFQYHTSGWTPVFKGAADLRETALGVWIGGFMWSIAVCSIVIVIFAYGRH
ncbi:hypothetical protein MVEN_01963100 [Mycena venus]|uniref:Uncharacterized protein n=1 Tax=Mycena venus TaxID=2733690 RepID=A0A8H6XHG1_9AGAR|nr:hypothetical protein MVEN_01963100 [Mycena venus]